MNNREYIKMKIPKNKKILEFGPLQSPIADKKTFPNVKYADIKTTEEVKKMYSGNEYLKDTGIYVDIDSIVDIDYVIKHDYKTDINDKFDVVILSHVIEHMPNILFFFQDVLNVIKDDGLLIINYPDKRYCFDHYRTDSCFADAYMIYKNKNDNSKMILDFYMNVLKENDPAFFWTNLNIISKLNSKTSSEILGNLEKKNKHGKYEDIHYWPFSDYGFLKFLDDAKRFGLLNFVITEFIPTQKNTQEFLVILKKSDNQFDDKLRNYINRYDPNIVSSIMRNALESKDAYYNIEKEKISKEVVDLENKIKKLENDNLYLRNELNKILNSKSWKITKPLRFIKKPSYKNK